MFIRTGKFTSFTKDNFKIAISFGVNASRMHAIDFVFDTSEGPNLLREDVIDPIGCPRYNRMAAHN